MTKFISSQTQKKVTDGQTDKVSYRADFQLSLKKGGEKVERVGLLYQESHKLDAYWYLHRS